MEGSKNYGTGTGEAPKAEARGLKGQERGWSSWEGAASPFPPAREPGGVLYKIAEWGPGQRPAAKCSLAYAKWLFLVF